MSDHSTENPPSQDQSLSHGRSRRDLYRWLIPFVLIAAPVFFYWPILHNEFVSLDDQITIYENPYFQRFTFGGVCAFWVGSYAGLYAPASYSLLVLIAVFSRAHTIHGRRPPFMFYPAPFHAADLILHVVNVWLVYCLLKRFVSRKWAAAGGALLFALHPVQVETVAWASETSNLLCTLFSLLALLLYLRSLPVGAGEDSPRAVRARRSNFILGSEVLVVAMLAKPLGVIVPLLVVTLHWLWRQKSQDSMVPVAALDAGSEVLRRAGSNVEGSGPSEYLRTGVDIAKPRPRGIEILSYFSGLSAGHARKILLWFALAIPFGIMARVAQPVPAWWLVVPLWIRPFVAADALAFYVCKILFPLRLVVDYDRSPRVLMLHGWWHSTWMLPAALAAGLIWMWWRKKAAMVIAGAMWFVASLLPVLGLTVFAYQHSSTVADRYLYLPMVGVAMIVAWALDQIPHPTADQILPRRARTIRYASLIVSAALLTLLGIHTYFQTDRWHDTQTLYDDTRQAIHRRPGAQQEDNGKNPKSTGPERYFHD